MSDAPLGFTRQPDDHEHMDMTAFPLPPETQIINVADSLIDLLDGPPHRYRQSAIKGTARQLRDMLIEHFAGKLPPKPADDCPF